MGTKAAILILICSLTGGCLSAAGSDDTWAQLKHVTRARNYVIITSDQSCYDGKILGVSDRSITLSRKDLEPIVIERKDVLRIADSGETDGPILYSGRSSWWDVTKIPLNSKQNTRVVMKSGAKHEGRLGKATDSEIVLTDHGKQTMIVKDEIAIVYFVRLRPLSDSDELLLNELSYLTVFDPKFWSYEWNAGPKIPVLLYDASKPEDDTPLRCSID